MDLNLSPPGYSEYPLMTTLVLHGMIAAGTAIKGPNFNKKQQRGYRRLIAERGLFVFGV
jgi:hypothetical protein